MSRFNWLAAIAALGLSACSDSTTHSGTDGGTDPSERENTAYNHESANREASPPLATTDTHLSAYASACVDQGEWSLEMCQCMDNEANERLSVPAKAYLTATTLGDSAQANRIAQDNGARVGIEAISFLTEGVMACS